LLATLRDNKNQQTNKQTTNKKQQQQQKNVNAKFTNNKENLGRWL